MSSHFPIGLYRDLVLARLPSVQSRIWEIKRNSEPIRKYPNAKQIAHPKPKKMDAAVTWFGVTRVLTNTQVNKRDNSFVINKVII